jgi:chemotaxis protein MotA
LDLGTIIGLGIAFGALLVANSLEGGSIGALISPSAALIVFGGSLGAAMVTQPLRNSLMAPMLLKHAILSRPAEPLGALETLTHLARVARREGVLALEGELHNVRDDFIRRGVQLVVDGTDPGVARAIMEIEIDALIERHTGAAKYYKTLGGLSPTLGVLGTVMGLVHMLSNLSDPGSMGPAIATAFLATLYGVGAANLVFLPIAQKLQMRSEEEQFIRRMVAVGIEGLQAGDSPIILAERLKAFLSPSEREAANRVLAEGQGGGAGESARAA